MFPIPWNKTYRKKDGTLSTIDEVIENSGPEYQLPTASSSTKGGIKIGTGLSMEGEVLNASQYELPTASSEVKGGVKVGSGLTISEEVLSADAQIPAYTSSESGKVLGVDSEGHLEWATPASGGGSFTLIGTVNSTDSDKTVTLPSDASEIYLFFTRSDANGYWGCKYMLLSIVEIIQGYNAAGVASISDTNRAYMSATQPASVNDTTLYFKYNATTKVVEILKMFQAGENISWTCKIYAK